MSENRATTGGIGLPPGTKIGKYEVVEMLAVGGQAVIYKCRDPFLDRLVAVKQISSTLAADPAFLERFRREAQILAKLGADTPGIVTIHELIEQPDGLFIVMEYIPGHTLERALEDNPGPVEVKAVLQILWKLAAAMHAVHSAGIIHRDLKPSNIIVSDGLRVTITDFGVAASTTGQTSMLLGTTKYMAPELFTGQAIDGRADIYSLGLIAYEMLIGRAKFREVFSDVMRDPHSESLRWMKWHGNLGVVAPPACEVNPGVPRSLSDLVVRMMAKKVDERFQSMEALGRAFKQSFSPRGRGGAGAGAAGVGEALPGARSVLDDSGAGMAPPASASAPLAERKETATAPLPRKKLSLKVKLALGGVAFVSLLVVLVAMVVSSTGQRREAEDKARQYYKQGTDAVAIADYAKAAGFFGQAAQISGAPREAAQGKVMELICKGHVSLEKRQWGECESYEYQADKELTTIQQQQKDWGGWAEDAKQKQLEPLKARRKANKGFMERLEAGRKAFEAKKYEDVKALLSEEALKAFMTSPAVKASMESVLKDLRQEANQMFETADRELMTRIAGGGIEAADALVKEFKFREAADAYKQAREKILTSKSLPEDERKRYLSRIDEKIKQMSREEDYMTRLDAVNQAEKQGQPDQMLANLVEADKLKPSQELKDRIAKVQQGMDSAKIRKLVENLELPPQVRRDALQKHLEKYPNDQWAKDMLIGLTRENERLDLLRKGNAAMETGDWAGAMQSFRQALRIMPDAEVDKKIALCDYQIKIGKARAFLEARQYPQAIDAAEAAAAALPEKAAEARKVAKDAADNKLFDEKIAGAIKSVQGRDWKRARDQLADAKKALPSRSADVDVLKTDVDYRQAMAQGDEAKARQEYAPAKFFYEQAQKLKNTPEIQERIQELKGLMGG